MRGLLHIKGATSRMGGTVVLWVLGMLNCVCLASRVPINSQRRKMSWLLRPADFCPLWWIIKWITVGVGRIKALRPQVLP